MLPKFLSPLMLGWITLSSQHTLAAPQQHRADFYVSPQGDDANPGTFERPFRTLSKSRDAVRSLKQKVRNKDILVYLRGGQYRPKETIVFGLRDSGSSKQSITYASYPGETATLNGSRRLPDWKPLGANEPLPPSIEHHRKNVWVYSNPAIKQIDVSQIGLTQEFPKKYRAYSIDGKKKQQVRISNANQNTK